VRPSFSMASAYWRLVREIEKETTLKIKKIFLLWSKKDRENI
jgi:hypothetical protein